jgi:acetyltransferase-like isoleucine patch superfamily enzyme
VTEKEKMLAGLLYFPGGDEAMSRERRQCKDLCHDYNQLRHSDTEARQKIMEQLLGKTKGRFTITAPFWCDLGYNIEIGENFYTNYNCVILDDAKVTFGDNVLIAPNCGFYTAGHPIDAAQRNTGLEYAYPITVGNNVWFGGGVQVMPGVSIGDNAIIGAGSVVTKDIPANVIAVGNPCKVLREITEQDKMA